MSLTNPQSTLRFTTLNIHFRFFQYIVDSLNNPSLSFSIASTWSVPWCEKISAKKIIINT